MRIHIVRHGETRHNVEQRIQGDLVDDDLNETGFAQADALWRHYASERVRGLHVTRVYSSPLQRARSTASRIAAALDLPEPEILRGAREISWGEYNGKKNEGAIRVEMERILGSWDKGDLAARAPGGETPGEAWERAAKDLAPLFERHARDDIVLVAHGRINKIMMSALLHGHLHHMDHYPQANAGISILQGPTPWQLARANTTEHLQGVRALDERIS